MHPSLIPSFCGAGYYGLRVHEAALAKGVKVTGATVHFVNEVPDGGRILLQQPVDVLPGDTPETLHRILKKERYSIAKTRAKPAQTAADAMLPERAAYRNSPVSGGISFCRISALRDRQKPSFKLYSKTRKM